MLEKEHYLTGEINIEEAKNILQSFKKAESDPHLVKLNLEKLKDEDYQLYVEVVALFHDLPELPESEFTKQYKNIEISIKGRQNLILDKDCQDFYAFLINQLIVLIDLYREKHGHAVKY